MQHSFPYEDFDVSYGRRFLDARLKAGFDSVADAADVIGVTRQFLHAVENDAKRPTLETLEKMASAYGVRLGDLFETTENGTEFDPIKKVLYGLPTNLRRNIILSLAANAKILLSAGQAIQQIATTTEAIRHFEAATEPEKKEKAS